MNSLDDLRATLDRHAADVTDSAVTARVVAVEDRARAVRRRRRTGVGVAAALAVAAAASLPLLQGGGEPRPADRELIGKVAPETMTSLGYTYAFAEGVESGDDGRATVRLGPSDGPRLISWAAEGEEVVVHTTVEGAEQESSATDFDDFVLVDAAEAGRWTVRGDGETALAVYELTDERPPGLTVDGVTFREDMTDRTLVDGVIGDVGDSDVSFQFTVPDAGVFLAELCQMVTPGTSLPARHWVNVEVDGDGVTAAGDCSDDPGRVDAGDGSGTWLDAGDYPAGETVTVRSWVSRGVDGDPVDVPGIRLGVAAYRLAEPAERVATWSLPWRTEYDGHVWEWTGSSGGSLPGTVGGTAPADAGLVLVATELAGRASNRYSTLVDGAVYSRTTTVGGGLAEIPVTSGAVVSVRFRGDTEGSATLAWYSRAD